MQQPPAPPPRLILAGNMSCVQPGTKSPPVPASRFLHLCPLLSLSPPFCTPTRARVHISAQAALRCGAAGLEQVSMPTDGHSCTSTTQHPASRLGHPAPETTPRCTGLSPSCSAGTQPTFPRQLQKRGTETEPEAHACCLCFFFFCILPGTEPRSIPLPSTEGMDGAGTSALLHPGVLSAPQHHPGRRSLHTDPCGQAPRGDTRSHQTEPSWLWLNVGHSHTRLGLGLGWENPRSGWGFSGGCQAGWVSCRSCQTPVNPRREIPQRNQRGARRLGFPPRLSRPSSWLGKLPGSRQPPLFSAAFLSEEQPSPSQA